MRISKARCETVQHHTLAKSVERKVTQTRIDIEEREGNTDIKIIILVLEGHYDSYELTPEASPYKDSGRSESEVGGVSESYKNNPGDPTLGGPGSGG